MSEKDDIESEMQLKPLPRMPDFHPRVDIRQFEELSELTPDQRRLVIPMLKAISRTDQKVEWFAGHLVNLHDFSRKVERRGISERGESKKTWRWFLKQIASALIGGFIAAIAIYYIHPK